MRERLAGLTDGFCGPIDIEGFTDMRLYIIYLIRHTIQT